MMTSFFDLMKYAHTGIASSGMTAYDKARARAMTGGGTVQTLTGIPPLSFKSDGTPLISWSMKGNGSQQGTPTPDNPIQPEFVGTKTAQLLEYYLSASSYAGTSIGSNGGIGGSNTYRVWVAKVTAGDTYTISGQADVYAYYATEPTASESAAVDGTRHFVSSGSTITIPSGASYIGARTKIDEFAMLNAGTEPLLYEPFGYKIPLTCAGQIVPVYLGQVSTVRRVKKIVLTGEETFVATTASTHYRCRTTLIPKATTQSSTSVLSTHYFSSAGARDGAITLTTDGGSVYFTDDTNAVTSEAFKAYLAAQYAAGHPVTIWYVLATPESAIVSEPLAKIGDNADELHSEDAGVTIPTIKGQNTLTVDTPIQPSEMEITYKG